MQTTPDTRNRILYKGEEMAAKKAHPGFKAVAAKIARKQGVSTKAASAMLAASSRRASPAAKKANPNLKRVSAKKKK
jgi:hypothetical protein